MKTAKNSQTEKAMALTNLLAAVVLEPTCVLRINMCKRQMKGGQLEQMWLDKSSGKEYWKAIPIVYV